MYGRRWCVPFISVIYNGYRGGVAYSIKNSVMKNFIGLLAKTTAYRFSRGKSGKKRGWKNN